jgi:hypothetical protein
VRRDGGSHVHADVFARLAVIEVRGVQDRDAEAWNEIAESSDDAWLTHTWEWNAAVEERARSGQRRSLVVLTDGRLVGILPLHLHAERRGPFSRRILHSNYFAGGGLALANDVVATERSRCFEAGFRAVHEGARRERVDKLRLLLPPLARRNLRSDPEVRRSIDDAFVDRSALALVVQLTGRTRDDVWRGMEGRSRTKARKAERAGVRVVESTGLSALEPYYALHLATQRRTHAAPEPRVYYEAILSIPFFHTFFAELEGRCIGAAIVALYAGRALYFASASLDEALHLGVNNLVQWHVLRWLVDAHAEAYEVGLVAHSARPGTHKMATIARFLESFGGERLPVHRADYVYDRPREAAFTFVRDILARVGRAEPDY